VIEKLHAEVSRILAMPEVVQRIHNLGNDVINSTPAEFGQIIRTELERWATLVKVLGWKAE
jgi:tripartite-type tricarboxylate transporter receptor subunit TctC